MFLGISPLKGGADLLLLIDEAYALVAIVLAPGLLATVHPKRVTSEVLVQVYKYVALLDRADVLFAILSLLEMLIPKPLNILYLLRNGS